MGFRSSAAKNGLPGEGRHEGLVPRNDVLTNGFMCFFSWTSPCTDTFCTSSALPLKNPQSVVNLKKAICVVRSDSIMGVTLKFFRCSSLSQLDDVGAGKLREMLAVHSNRHAVHGRFTLKDDCERQVWNARAALRVVSKTKTEARSTQNSKTKHPISKTKHPKLENEDP